MDNKSAIYLSLKDKVVFILGGSSGIGADFVEAFAKQGSKVAFVGRNEQSSNELIEKLKNCSFKPKFYKCDIKNLKALEESIEDCIKSIGDIGILLNNAANDERHDFKDMTHEYFEWEYQTNLRPHVFAAKAVIESMIRLGSGSIINLGSIGWMRKNEKTVLYGIFKSSMHGLTNGLARRFGKNRIRVNTLVPGWTMTKKQIEKHLDEEGEKKINEGQCLPDKVKPQDISNAALFLASDESKMITSQNIIVDGGWT
jgi:NAD(P)-dependent dehydrogenase (short-subunit alcohol dehydrogenase family)